MFSATNFFTVSFGDNKFILFVFLNDLADRDLTAYLRPTLTLTFFSIFSVDEQSTHTFSRQEESYSLVTSGARQGNPTFFIEECDGFTVHSGGEHLKGPGHLRLIRENRSVPGVSLW